jgi:hypothetical protein
MDRAYKKEDLVHVYAASKHGELLATFKDKPYTLHGFDNYQYKGTMYEGFKDLDSDKVYILLNSPLSSMGGRS